MNLSKLRIHLLKLVGILLVGLLPTNLYATSKEVASPPILIDTQWLQTALHKSAASITILDLRSKEDYLNGHIPGAINIPFHKFSRSINQVSGFLLTPQKFQELVEGHGIKTQDHLVVYSGRSILDSTRVFWAFDFYGHKKLSILDGGWPIWESKNLNIEMQEIALPPSNYAININPEKLATKFQTFMTTKHDSALIIDARPEAEFQGYRSKTEQLGHIPTAMNIPWKSVLSPTGDALEHENITQFPSMQTLQNRLQSIPEDKQIVLYCNDGRETSALYFGLKLLGREAAVYDGSWFEWSSDKSLPIKSKVD